MISDLAVGDKVKTKLMPMTCGLWNRPEPGQIIRPPNFHHTWEVIKIEEDIITLQDKKGEIMLVDRDGNGIENYTNHHIYKTTKK